MIMFPDSPDVAARPRPTFVMAGLDPAIQGSGSLRKI
jgi:hypothetical protein